MTTKKEAATGEGAATISTTFQCHSNSLACQRQRMIAWLWTYGSINTLQARRELDILHPAGRIKELRDRGFNIVTTWQYFDDHKIGRYILMKKVAADV